MSARARSSERILLRRDRSFSARSVRRKALLTLPAFRYPSVVAISPNLLRQSSRAAYAATARPRSLHRRPGCHLSRSLPNASATASVTCAKSTCGRVPVIQHDRATRIVARGNMVDCAGVFDSEWPCQVHIVLDILSSRQGLNAKPDLTPQHIKDPKSHSTFRPRYIFRGLTKIGINLLVFVCKRTQVKRDTFGPAIRFVLNDVGKESLHQGRRICA